MKSIALALVLTFSAVWPLAAFESSQGSTIYDPNPNHLWNRLNETLFQRTVPDGKKVGLDELDILYWLTTTNLLLGPSHQQALAVMDEFIHLHGEKLISDPLKRALLQRDLWELFDWSAKHIWKADEMRAAGELQPRLATVIHLLALTTNEIATLPDNYARAKGLADLPHELFATNGDWLSVSGNDYNPVPVAPTHLHSFDGHSAFSVMLHLPGGRNAAMVYLDKLRTFKQSEEVWMYESNRFSWVSTNAPREVLVLNPNIPQFSPGTEWALVRRMCVIDTEGRIQPTTITESIQKRRYLKIEGMNQFQHDAQEFFEFEMDKRHGAELREIGKDEDDFSFVHFRGQGIDIFERAFGNSANAQRSQSSSRHQIKALNTCFECHSGAGVFSVLSYTGFEEPPAQETPVDLAPVPFTREATATIYWKQRQYDWGLLQGLWLGETY